MANKRSLEGSKSWLSSVVGNITGMWESMKSPSAPNTDGLDSRNSTHRHHDTGNEGDIQGRRSLSAHERGSSSFLGRMRRRSTVEGTVKTDGQNEHLDEDAGRSSSFQEKSSFSFLSSIGGRSTNERAGSADCQRKSFGEDGVYETLSSLQGGGSSSFLSSCRRRSQGEHSENTDIQRSLGSKDGIYERILSEKSPSTFLSRIKRHSKGDDTVITTIPFLYGTAEGSDGVVNSSKSGRFANTARASAMRMGKDSIMYGIPDFSSSMGDVSTSPSSQEEITIVAHNSRKRVHGSEQLEGSGNIFTLEMPGANVSFPKKFRKTTAEPSDLHQVGSAVFHPQFNLPKEQRFPTIFSSSAAQLMLSDSEHSDHGCSSPRTLSSRTKSILDGLDKVGSPIMNAHKWRFTDEPEQWASDLLNSSAQKPPADIGRTISRGNVVSDAISHSVVRHNHKRRRIARQQTRAIRSGVTESSVHVTPQRSSSKQPSPVFSKKLAPVKVTVPPRVESASLIKPLKQILRHTDRSSTSAANNNFSAKWAELGVVRHEDISTQTTIVEPVTANVETAHPAHPSPPERMFDFTNAQRRAPSQSFIREDAHTSEVDSRQLSGRNRHRSEAESEIVEDGSKKAAVEKNSTLQRGASQGSQEERFSEDKRATKPHDGVPVENGGHIPIADTNVTAASQAGFTFPKDIAKPVQWSCKTCFVSNKAEADKCVACGESKGTVSGAGKATGDTGDKQWFCKTCFVSNGSHSRECSLCGQVRSDSSAKNESFCKQCFVKALPGKDNCVSCGAHLTMSTNAPVENVFGSRAFKPASASGSGSKYVFGFTSSSAGSTSQIIPTDAISAPVSFEPGTSVSANISAEASGLQEAARFDTNHGNLTPGLGLPVSSSTSDVGTASEQAGHAAPQNIEAEHKVKEVQANVAQSTTREGAHLMGASGTMGQGTPTSVFSTLAAPAANKPLAPSAPLFGSLSTSVSTATPQAASAFNFGGTSETQPPTLFGFTTSGAPHATTAPVTSTTTAVLSFSTAAAPSQEDESDSRGTLASNSVEMMSPVEPPSESAAAPLQPFSFAAAANTAQPSGLFNFGTSVTAAPTGTSNTRGLFGGVNTNGALGIAPAAPFQFHPPPAATRAFTTPSVVSSAPSFFNFGGSSTTNGSTEGFSFGSTTTPAFFNFGAQPGPAPSFVFGNNPSSAPPAFMTAPTTNFFASGSSSSTTTTRKMLKARRIRR